MITSYEDLHYDVLNLGRQEAWMGLETIEAILDTTKDETEFVSANLVKVKTGKPVAKPYVIKDYGNFRVGILGLLNETDFPKNSALLDSTKLRVDPYLEAAKKYVPMLRKKADAVVLLCELPTAAIDSLTKALPDQIDLVISTGALRAGETLSNMGKTRVVGPGSSGYSGHYATLEFNPSWTDSVAVVNWTDFLTDQYEEKGEWTEKMAAFSTAPVTTPTPAGGSVKPTITPMGTSPTAPTMVKPVQPSPTNTAPKSEHEGHSHG